MDLHDKIVHGWDISAEGYSKRVVQDDFISPGKEIWTDLILSKAPIEGKMKILDVGTGPGVFTTILSLAGHDLTGIDISEKMLEQARENSVRSPARVSPDGFPKAHVRGRYLRYDRQPQCGLDHGGTGACL